ncbi:MAG: trigger factor, partial [Candidatus Gracilibacteria bacterium]|nr:trigger factor [Candidatus Gracilibacteria bacterium]
MKVEAKKMAGSIVELILEDDITHVASHRKHVMEYLEKNAEIKGFRKGAKIPEAVIVQKYGEDKINAMIVEDAIDHMFREALKEENLIPMGQAEVIEVISQNPIKVKMKVEIFPSIEIKNDYKKIKLEKTNVEVKDSEVEQALEEIQTRFTKFEKCSENEACKMGDKIFIDTEGFDKSGNFLENTNMSNYPIILGSNILVPGFEEKIAGAKLGEELELDIVFPKDYHNLAFASKETKFKVKVNSIEKAIKPEFTPEFIEQLRGKKLDLEGFKELVKRELFDVKESNARLNDENKLIEELLKISTIDLGEKMIENQVDKVFEEIKEDISKSGAKPADYISSLGMTEETYKETNVKPIAIKRLQGELLLYKLNELEKTEVTTEELNEEIQKVFERFSSEDVIARLKELYKEGTKYY